MRRAVEDGFDVNSLGLKGRNALHLAAIEGNLKSIDFLLYELSAYGNKLDDRGRNAIYFAACNKQKEATAMLFKESHPEIAFFELAKRRDLDGMRTLAAAIPSTYNFNRAEAIRVFDYAIEYRQYDVITFLFEIHQLIFGITVNDNPYVLDLYQSAMKTWDDPFAVSLLLKEGLSINIYYICYFIRSPRMCRCLIDNGFDINARLEDGSTVMHCLIRNLDYSNSYEHVYFTTPAVSWLMDVFLESGADMKSRNHRNQTMLLEVLENRSNQTIHFLEFLIVAGCPLDPYLTHPSIHSALANYHRERDRVLHIMEEMKILPVEIYGISLAFIFIIPRVSATAIESILID